MEHTEFAAPIGDYIDGGKVMYGDDSGLVVRFYRHKIEDLDYVRINAPGDQKTEWDREATEMDKMRFQRLWGAYQQKLSQVGDETPLDGWEIPLNDHQIIHFKSFHIHTVENLAALNDNFLQAMGPGMLELRTKAQRWLESNVERRKEAHAQKELAKRDNEIELLKERLKEIELASEPKRGPGRPPKGESHVST